MVHTTVLPVSTVLRTVLRQHQFPFRRTDMQPLCGAAALLYTQPGSV